MGKLILQDLNKIYPNGIHAVRDFNLVIEDGEFIVFVGPSGCGKTTTLRMIAGLENITSGVLTLEKNIEKDGIIKTEAEILNNKAPKDRDMAMVFQNYALYAHMSVYHNMAFSLTLRKEKPDMIHERVMEAARILELVPYLNRKPRALSGGQRQRVALGRAIVRKPECFLLDEPLSNLDAKLRGSMRKELKALHRLLKVTMIYVTHDQVEAMTLADRIVVMKDGDIQQIGTAKEIYDNPVNLFVGSFIGTPPMNFIEGTLEKDGYFYFSEQKIKVTPETFARLKMKDYLGKTLIMGVRPEQFLIGENNFKQYPDAIVSLYAEVVELLGPELLIHSNLQGRDLMAKVSVSDDIKSHQNYQVAVDMRRVHFFDKETTARVSEW